MFHFLFGFSSKFHCRPFLVGVVVFCGFPFAHSCSGNRRILGFHFSIQFINWTNCVFLSTYLTVCSPSSLIVFVLNLFSAIWFWFLLFSLNTPGVIIYGSLDVSSSTSSLTGGNSLFICPDSYCSTPFSPFLECLVAKDNSFLLPLAQVGLVNVTLQSSLTFLVIIFF